MDQSEVQQKSQLLMNLTFGALRVADAALNDLAIELLGQLAPQIVYPLLEVAAETRNHPSHRVRALLAIRRVGRLPAEDAFDILIALTIDKSPQVRDVAARLVTTLRQSPWHQDGDVPSIEGDDPDDSGSELQKPVRRRRLRRCP